MFNRWLLMICSINLAHSNHLRKKLILLLDIVCIVTTESNKQY